MIEIIVVEDDEFGNALLKEIEMPALTEDQVKYMVDRFLGWKLPADFNPDAGISFKAHYNEHTAHPAKHEPTGTNLFDASQADAMVRYMADGLPETKHDLPFHEETIDSLNSLTIRK